MGLGGSVVLHKGISNPPVIDTQQSRHISAMQELCAIEMAEMGENSAIRRAVMYHNKTTRSPISPNDALLKTSETSEFWLAG